MSAVSPYLKLPLRTEDEVRAKATCDESDCPGHIASDADPKVCGRCGVHIDSLSDNAPDVGGWEDFIVGDES